MDHHQRWRPTVNEREFIERALQSDLRVDGRRPFDFRRLKILFGREDGSAEVQLGDTRVMGYATAQLVQPYKDRPNEGTLAIFTEFSPMADPAFEPGRPGESAIELGRVVDRGLRESRAVDMESLCVVAGKHVWSVRVDLHILDNGGNLIDAANIAALAALSTFRRPECTVGGEDGQQVTVHDPEVRDPLPLTIHHLPIAVTFAYFGEGNIMVIDPTYKEEAVMGGRMTATINSNGDVCSIQKAGGEGVMSSVIMQCLRIASVKAADITSKIKNEVNSYTSAKALQKVKRLPASALKKDNAPDVAMKESSDGALETQSTKPSSDGQQINKGDDEDHRNIKRNSSLTVDRTAKQKQTSKFIGGPSNWDPYSKGVSLSSLRISQLPEPPSVVEDNKQEDVEPMLSECNPEAQSESRLTAGGSDEMQEAISPKSLKDAVKPKHKRKKKQHSKS
ncbi:exosome complex component RRP45A-like isoform X1 [Oryza glaberrima]|uniref:exosome complex component RRP45A-like isoform X1 n=1 Tax=Oryza glaberrima TaxID=4538 RepID=UPI00224C5A5A|nr:exosome complex component RRP45A-like isoform X1 [Oryza glaberrima]XP_052145683.1 exosome complex component RRP45A-like isoform X1 [Oryza glaberrima]